SAGAGRQRRRRFPALTRDRRAGAPAGRPQPVRLRTRAARRRAQALFKRPFHRPAPSAGDRAPADF
ncbi:TPA: hypothetical protein ACKFH8_005704, partial [Burkholderia multivorans]